MTYGLTNQSEPLLLILDHQPLSIYSSYGITMCLGELMKVA